METYKVHDEKFQDKLNIIEIESGDFAGTRYIYTVVSVQEDHVLRFQYVALNHKFFVKQKEDEFEQVISEILVNLIDEEGK